MRDRDFAELIAVLVVGIIQLVSRFICFVCLLAHKIFSEKKKEKGGKQVGKVAYRDPRGY